MSANSLPEAAFFCAEDKVQLLSGACPRNITKARLREWLSYRKGTSKDGSAKSDATKAKLLIRVVSYMKNGWDVDFVPKWQHLLGSNQIKLTDTAGTACDFPSAGQCKWIPLLKAKTNVPSFNMQNMVSYFIERKAKDNEANKDYKNVSNKAFGLFRCGHIQNVEVAIDNDKAHFRCNCLPEMKKDSMYKLKLSVLKSGIDEGEIVFSSCVCPAGKGPYGSCKHIAALCYALEEFTRLKCVPEFQTCTSRLQTWNQPRKRKLDPETVYYIDFSRKIYKKQKKKNPKPLTDPRQPCDRNDNHQSVNKDFLDKIKEVIPNCGFFCLLSEEKLDQKECTIISPIKEHPVPLTEIFNRAERVKQNLFVDEIERKEIASATKKQSKCKEWYSHRRVRITASKCKWALLKPTTSPTKAIREILHYNGNYQSAMMKQGLVDEKLIAKLYENKIGCTINETGFIISRSHPFLGATPDGEVDGGLVEIKRIFSSGLTLRDAVCKHNICKQTSHGLVVNKNHKFYHQIHLQMFCAECQWTDLLLSDLNDLIILHIKKCDCFLSSTIPKLELFYDKHIAIELAYPRVAYGLQRLSKLLEA